MSLCILAGCSSADEDLPIRSACGRLADHLVELRVEGANVSAKELDAHRSAMKRALGDGFLASCEERLTAAELRCGLAARDLAAVTACGTAADSK